MTDTQYKVSVYSSKLGIPLQFAVHAYIVTECHDIINRYEVFAPFTLPQESAPYKGLIYKNLLRPETGFLLWYRKKKWWREDEIGRRWNPKIHSSVTGTTNSDAHKLFCFIEGGGLDTYPYHSEYKLVRGPNSNFFAQWIINQVPECGLTLPWNAWGKNYKK